MIPSHVPLPPPPPPPPKKRINFNTVNPIIGSTIDKKSFQGVQQFYPPPVGSASSPHSPSSGRRHRHKRGREGGAPPPPPPFSSSSRSRPPVPPMPSIECGKNGPSKKHRHHGSSKSPHKSREHKKGGSGRSTKGHKKNSPRALKGINTTNEFNGTTTHGGGGGGGRTTSHKKKHHHHHHQGGRDNFLRELLLKSMANRRRRKRTSVTTYGHGLVQQITTTRDGRRYSAESGVHLRRPHHSHHSSSSSPRHRRLLYRFQPLSHSRDSSFSSFTSGELEDAYAEVREEEADAWRKLLAHDRHRYGRRESIESFLHRRRIRKKLEQEDSSSASSSEDEDEEGSGAPYGMPVPMGPAVYYPTASSPIALPVHAGPFPPLPLGYRPDAQPYMMFAGNMVAHPNESSSSSSGGGGGGGGDVYGLFVGGGGNESGTPPPPPPSHSGGGGGGPVMAASFASLPPTYMMPYLPPVMGPRRIEASTSPFVVEEAEEGEDEDEKKGDPFLFSMASPSPPQQQPSTSFPISLHAAEMTPTKARDGEAPHRPTGAAPPRYAASFSSLSSSSDRRSTLPPVHRHGSRADDHLHPLPHHPPHDPEGRRWSKGSGEVAPWEDGPPAAASPTVLAARGHAHRRPSRTPTTPTHANRPSEDPCKPFSKEMAIPDDDFGIELPPVSECGLDFPLPPFPFPDSTVPTAAAGEEEEEERAGLPFASFSPTLSPRGSGRRDIPSQLPPAHAGKEDEERGEKTREGLPSPRRGGGGGLMGNSARKVLFSRRSPPPKWNSPSALVGTGGGERRWPSRRHHDADTTPGLHHPPTRPHPDEAVPPPPPPPPEGVSPSSLPSRPLVRRRVKTEREEEEAAGAQGRQITSVLRTQRRVAYSRKEQQDAEALAEKKRRRVLVRRKRIVSNETTPMPFAPARLMEGNPPAMEADGATTTTKRKKTIVKKKKRIQKKDDDEEETSASARSSTSRRLASKRKEEAAQWEVLPAVPPPPPPHDGQEVLVSRTGGAEASSPPPRPTAAIPLPSPSNSPVAVELPPLLPLDPPLFSPLDVLSSGDGGGDAEARPASSVWRSTSSPPSPSLSSPPPPTQEGSVPVVKSSKKKRRKRTVAARTSPLLSSSPEVPASASRLGLPTEADVRGWKKKKKKKRKIVSSSAPQEGEEEKNGDAVQASSAAPLPSPRQLPLSLSPSSAGASRDAEEGNAVDHSRSNESTPKSSRRDVLLPHALAPSLAHGLKEKDTTPNGGEPPPVSEGTVVPKDRLALLTRRQRVVLQPRLALSPPLPSSSPFSSPSHEEEETDTQENVKDGGRPHSIVRKRRRRRRWSSSAGGAALSSILSAANTFPSAPHGSHTHPIVRHSTATGSSGRSEATKRRGKPSNAISSHRRRTVLYTADGVQVGLASCEMEEEEKDVIRMNTAERSSRRSWKGQVSGHTRAHAPDGLSPPSRYPPIEKVEEEEVPLSTSLPSTLPHRPSPAALRPVLSFPTIHRACPFPPFSRALPLSSPPPLPPPAQTPQKRHVPPHFSRRNSSASSSSGGGWNTEAQWASAPPWGEEGGGVAPSPASPLSPIPSATLPMADGPSPTPTTPILLVMEQREAEAEEVGGTRRRTATTIPTSGLPTEAEGKGSPTWSRIQEDALRMTSSSSSSSWAISGVVEGPLGAPTTPAVPIIRWPTWPLRPSTASALLPPPLSSPSTIATEVWRRAHQPPLPLPRPETPLPLPQGVQRSSRGRVSACEGPHREGEGQRTNSLLVSALPSLRWVEPDGPRRGGAGENTSPPSSSSSSSLALPSVYPPPGHPFHGAPYEPPHRSRLEDQGGGSGGGGREADGGEGLFRPRKFPFASRFVWKGAESWEEMEKKEQRRRSIAAAFVSHTPPPSSSSHGASDLPQGTSLAFLVDHWCTGEYAHRHHLSTLLQRMMRDLLTERPEHVREWMHQWFETCANVPPTEEESRRRNEIRPVPRIAKKGSTDPSPLVPPMQTITASGTKAAATAKWVTSRSSASYPSLPVCGSEPPKH